MRRVSSNSPPSEVTTALRKVRARPYLKSATIFGRSIHALVDEDVTQEQLTEDVAKLGVKKEEIRPLVADLEDVFVELTYRRPALEESRA